MSTLIHVDHRQAQLGKLCKVPRLPVLPRYFGFWILDFGLKKNCAFEVLSSSSIENPKSKIQNFFLSEWVTQEFLKRQPYVAEANHVAAQFGRRIKSELRTDSNHVILIHAISANTH